MARMLYDVRTTPTSHSCRRDGSDRTVLVEFVVPPRLAGHAQLLAEFAGWAPIAMDRQHDGSHRVDVWLHPGDVWRYQFLLDDRVIVNDPRASVFGEGRNGGHVSMIRT